MAIAEKTEGIRRLAVERESTDFLPAAFPHPAALPLFLARRSSAAVQERLNTRLSISEVATFWRSAAMESDLPSEQAAFRFLAADYLSAIDRSGYPGAVNFLCEKGILKEDGLVNLPAARRLFPHGCELFDWADSRWMGELTTAYHLIKQSLPDPLQLLAETLGWREKGRGRTSLLFQEPMKVIDGLAKKNTDRRRPIVAFFGAGRKAEEAVLAIQRGFSVVLIDRDETDKVQDGFAATLAAFGLPVLPEVTLFENGFSGGGSFRQTMEEAQEEQRVVLVRADFSQSMEVEPFCDVAASIMALHHVRDEKRTTMVENMNRAAREAVVVYDCTAEGLGLAKVVMPVGIWLAQHRGAVATHFDAIASYIRGPTVKELGDVTSRVTGLRWTVGLSRPVPEAVVPPLQVRAVGTKA
ncbi:MAG: hypothetical protein ABH807_01905 [Candidatus Shapirobacteria bacterium]